jgi:hypothetical protein
MILSMLFCAALILGGVLYACSGYLGTPQCTPLVYPSGEHSKGKSYEVANININDPFEEVILF